MVAPSTLENRQQAWREFKTRLEQTEKGVAGLKPIQLKDNGVYAARPELNTTSRGNSLGQHTGSAGVTTLRWGGYGQSEELSKGNPNLTWDCPSQAIGGWVNYQTQGQASGIADPKRREDRPLHQAG